MEEIMDKELTYYKVYIYMYKLSVRKFLIYKKSVYLFIRFEKKEKYFFTSTYIFDL